MQTLRQSKSEHPNADGAKRLFKKGKVERLGRRNSKTCLLELLPLPSPSVNVWLYKDFSKLSELRSREEYREKIAPNRISSIRSLIKHYKPKRVVFYSKTYEHFWVRFLDSTVQWRAKNKISFAREDNVEYMILPHPIARGVTNSLYEESSLVQI